MYVEYRVGNCTEATPLTGVGGLGDLKVSARVVREKLSDHTHHFQWKCQ